MKKLFAFLLSAAMGLALTACGAPNTVLPQVNGDDIPTAAQQGVLSETNEPNIEAGTSESEISIILTVGDHNFRAALLNNETTAAFIEVLPLTLDMSELNGNEKYFYMDNELPTDPCQPGQINAGDLMLYGDNCLVLFYESFSSDYSYTRLGSLDDPAGLSEALGSGSAEVTFSIGGE